MEKFWLCIDDTDDTTKNIGTGQIASEIYKRLQSSGCRMRFKITRHQLLLDDRIAYTSHNSSMCMEGMSTLSLEELCSVAIDTVMELRSPISHPGVCIYMPDGEVETDKLIRFGLRAKREVLSIDLAKRVASEIRNLVLCAPSGNGAGQIGALAGVGLRIYGNDGTFRGKIKIPEPIEETVADMEVRLGVEAIWDSSADRILEAEELVRVNQQAKLVLHDHKPMAAVVRDVDDTYLVCSKAQIYEATITRLTGVRDGCADFVWDNDAGEQWNEQAGTCVNCLYRRLTEKGMKCTK